MSHVCSPPQTGFLSVAGFQLVEVVAGMALGMVMQLPDQDDETSVSRRQLLAKLDVCMGGRVAEELIFGESNITTGTCSYYRFAGQ